MDPETPVVKLCAAGMQAEWEGRPADALALFMQAWESRRDDYEACIAAHYVARHQPTPEAAHDWNARALQHAEAVADARIAGFYPSLYLNMGKSCETLGNPAEARRFYDLAAAALHTLPDDDPYANMVRYAISSALARTSGDAPTYPAKGD